MTHEDVWNALPWYATGRIPADERAGVERHLALCAACRREAEVQRRLRDTIGRIEPDLVAARAGAARIARRRPAVRGLAWGGAAIAAAAALAVGLSSIEPDRLRAPAFATLTDGAPPAGEVRIRPAPGADLAALTALLDAEGVVVRGAVAPDAVVRGRIPPGVDPAALIDRLMADPSIAYVAGDAR